MYWVQILPLDFNGSCGTGVESKLGGRVCNRGAEVPSVYIAPKAMSFQEFLKSCRMAEKFSDLKFRKS